MKPYYEHAGITIYHGDCREILPCLPVAFCRACGCELADESILSIHLAANHDVVPFLDAVLTDPPYGINLDVQRYGGARISDPVTGAKFARGGDRFQQFDGEREPIDLAFVFGFGELQIVWGANNWPQGIPFNPKRDGWICWDKRTNEKADRMLGSPFELAVIIGKRHYEIFRLQHGGAINADNTNEPRWHPTQKPIRLMQRVLKMFLPDKSACDPFMGSGTTLLAAKRLGYRAIGIEIEEKYCEIAATRLSQEVLQFADVTA